MRVEIKFKLGRGMINVQKKLKKMFASMLSKATNATTKKFISIMTETGSPIDNQKSATSSATSIIVEKKLRWWILKFQT